MKLKNRFWLAVFLTFVAAFAVAGDRLYDSLLPNWHLPQAASSAQTEVRATDLLSVLLTVSGVTIPVLIGYLILKAKELQIGIAERTEFHLKQAGHSVETYNFVKLYLSDDGNPDVASPAFNCVGEFLSMGGHEGDENLTSDSHDALFPTKSNGRIYNGCFATGNDRSVITLSTIVTGIAAFICLTDMCIRFYRITSLWLDSIEQFIIPFTAMMNVTSYVFLIWIVHKKQVLRSEAYSRVKSSCKQIKPEIDSALRASNKGKSDMKSEINRLSGGVIVNQASGA